MSWGYVIRKRGATHEVATLWTCGEAIRYVATDGSIHAMCVQAAWCLQCRGFVFAERFTTVDEVANDVRAAFESAHGSSDTLFLRDALASQLKARMEQLRFAIGVSQMRRGEPKCLACGSENIEALSERGPAHPSYVATAILGDAMRHFTGSYNSEGLRIAG
jgi:hypothetical protein